MNVIRITLTACLLTVYCLRFITGTFVKDWSQSDLIRLIPLAENKARLQSEPTSKVLIYQYNT